MIHNKLFQIFSQPLLTKMLKVNKDVLFLILNELKDDHKSLFSYLLVNKLWCETTVPILWRDPWKYIKYEKHQILFNIILSHLTESSRELLINEGIKIIQTEQQNLLFDYISYCKYMIDILEYFCWTISKLTLDVSQSTLLEQEIYKLFMSRCFTMKTLDLYLMACPIYQLPGANACLSKLHELRCVTTTNGSFFYGLLKICKLIEEIFISLQCDDLGLAELIKMQKQIKYLKILVHSDQQEYKSITEALEKQAHSIIFLNLWMTESFPHSLFPKLINLKTLLLHNDNQSRHQEAYMKYLTASVYSKLEILELSTIPLDIATKIIQNTKGNLWKILIQGSINFNDTKDYFQAICKYCPNVEYVSTFINDQNLGELEQLLTSCHHLKGLDVQIAKDFHGIDIFLNLLAKSAPVNLYKLQFELNKLNVKSLDMFFNYWRGRKALCLYYLRPHQIKTTTILELIEKYKADGVIKHLKNFKGFWEVDKRSNLTWIDYLKKGF